MPQRRMGAWVVGASIIGTVLLGVGAFWLSFTALADLEHPRREAMRVSSRGEEKDEQRSEERDEAHHRDCSLSASVSICTL